MALRRSYRTIAALILIGAVLAAFVSPLASLTIVGLILAVFFIARNLEFGLILLVFFFPYLGLVIDFSAIEAFRSIPFLRSIDAPFVDLFGLLFLAACGLRWIFTPLNIKKFAGQFPHWRSYLAFWLSGLISLVRVPSIQFGASIKYFARPFTFFYLVFFAPVVNILTRIRNQESPHQSKLGAGQAGIMERALKVFYFTGLISAFDGLLGLFFAAHTDFPRATPFGFLGVNPLGPNHNLLAETLIATAPAGLILVNHESGIMNQRTRWIRYGMFFQWAVALLTLARTAWIAIAAQAAIYAWLTQRGKIKDALKRWSPAIALAAALGAALVATTFTESVRGSTLSRLDQARIAAFYFARSPFFGQGVGTFLPTLWHTKAFLLEYGEPFEAHGIIWKLMFEQSMLGLLTFALFVGAILRSIWKPCRKNPNAPLIAALLIAVGSLTYQLFNTTYYTSKLWVPLAIAVAVSRIMNHELGIRNRMHQSHNS